MLLIYLNLMVRFIKFFYDFAFMIEIDGNYLEGGGQIIRNSLALSALTGKPFKITDIRKGRQNPGLQAQHLSCVNAVKELCNADVENAFIGSETLTFIPRKIKAKNISIDVGTAGSLTLILQSLLLPCFFAGKKINIEMTGGTDVAWSMPVDYFKNVYVPHILRFCKSFEMFVPKRGYYPKGNGKIEIQLKPKYDINEFSSFDELIKKLREEKPIEFIEREKLMIIKGISHASMDLESAKVAERQSNAAKNVLNNYQADIRSEYCNTLSTGSGITLWAIYGEENKKIILGADSLGARGKSAELVGQEAAKKLFELIGSEACADENLEDNMIPWLALFSGKIKVHAMTNHTLTNIYTTEQFLGKCFEIDMENKTIEVKK